MADAVSTVAGGSAAPVLAHLTTTDMSLDWLLGPQLRAFAAAGYEVVGLSAPGPHVEALAAAGIRHVPLASATRSFAPGRDVRAAAELAGALRRLRPTILHTHNPKPGVYGRAVGRAVGVPVVVNTQHGLYAQTTDPSVRRASVYAAERLAAACSDAELVQNEEDLELLARLGVPRSKLRLLGNGIDLHRFDPAAVPPGARDRARAEMGVRPEEVLIGAVGRLVREKGFAELFAAWRLLRDRLPSARLVVIGPAEPDKADGLDPADVAAARDAGVLFLGARDDMMSLYPAMDLYVLASHREGFPRSAMEAAAMGLPIVATDIRGCRQVVRPHHNGLLVPPRDPVALADAMGALVARPELRRAMGSVAAALAVERFDQQRVIDITLDTYARLRARARST